MSAEVFDGMTLFSPTQSGGANGPFHSYLVDNDMNVINSWSHPRGAASMPYLLKDSTLIYPYKVPNPTMNSGGVGGGGGAVGGGGCGDSEGAVSFVVDAVAAAM